MGISYKNSSGYADPTAYEAVKNIEAEAKILRIQYPTGYMELNMEALFPATLERAKKLFQLIHRYCTEDEKLRLETLLAKKEQQLGDQINSFINAAAKAPHNSHEYQNYMDRLHTAERLHRRIQRNIELYEEGKV